MTLLDSDTIIMRPEVFGLLREMEKEHALIVLGEGPMNGGMWHLRGSKTPNVLTPSIWVIEQVRGAAPPYNPRRGSATFVVADSFSTGGLRGFTPARCSTEACSSSSTRCTTTTSSLD